MISYLEIWYHIIKYDIISWDMISYHKIWWLMVKKRKSVFFMVRPSSGYDWLSWLILLSLSNKSMFFWKKCFFWSRLSTFGALFSTITDYFYPGSIFSENRKNILGSMWRYYCNRRLLYFSRAHWAKITFAKNKKKLAFWMLVWCAQKNKSARKPAILCAIRANFVANKKKPFW